jgi:hypothetical protein
MRLISQTFPFLFCVFFLGCTSPKYTAENLPEEQLVFGSGGGFAGTVTEYMLLTNGQLFVHESLNDTIVELKRRKPKEAKALFDELAAMNFRLIDLHQPDNISYFIEWKTREQPHRVVWGFDLENKVDQRVKDLYEKLTGLVEN